MTASDRVDNLRGTMLAVLAAAAGLAGGGVAAAVAAGTATATIFGIPAGIVLAAIAAALFAAAAVSFGLADVLAGELGAAEIDLAAKAAAAAAWRDEEAKLRAQVNASCSLADATACLNRLSPC